MIEVQKRVLGADHPKTLTTANNLASTLFVQGQLTEAERMMQATLASCQRVLGPAHWHVDTLQTASGLENMRA